jgi:hypothetical protein
MNAMEPSTVGQPPASGPTRTDATNTFKTAGAPSDRHFEPMIVPGIVGRGPILPAWLRKLFQRKHTHA